LPVLCLIGIPLEALSDVPDNTSSVVSDHIFAEQETSQDIPYASLKNIRVEFFTKYRSEIKSNLPQGIAFRLPTNLHLLSLPNDNQEQADFQVVQLLEPAGLKATLQVCHSSDGTSLLVGEPSCITGYLFAISLDSPAAQAELATHIAFGYPFTINRNLQGHYKEYREGSETYASLMWQQDNQFYGIQFPVAERLHLLYMAQEMANGIPLGGNRPRKVKKS
jgi:hypothetical protein